MRTLGTILLPVAILCLAQATLAQAPDWIWATNSGSVSNDYGNAVCTDTEGNAYVAGTFQGATITFGNHVLQNTAEGYLDFFVVKYDPEGNVVWAVNDGGKKNDYAYGICTDAIGNVFITGYFTSDSLPIGPSLLVNPSLGPNYPDVFTAKYDPNGNALWGRSGESEVAYGNGIGSDASGNVYITGSFRSSISFDGYMLQGYGDDGFLVKYDTDGNVAWGDRMGGTATDWSRAMDVDPDGNAYVTGFFMDSASFGKTTLVSANPYGYMEIFVAKFDSDGDNVWANYALVPYIGNYASGTGIAADEAGSVYLTGYFQYTLAFGNDTLGNAGNHGTFLAKYDSDGQPLWGRSPGGTGNDFGAAVCTEANGNVLVTGHYESPFLSFSGYPVVNANAGYDDVFVARYDPNGNALGATGIGGPGNEYGMSITGSPGGEVYLTGYFGSYSVDFSGTVLTNTGSNDTFLAKMPSDAMNSVPTVEGSADVSLYPNPAHDRIHFLSEGLSEVRVYDVASRKILVRQFTNMTTIDVTAMPSGLYVYELKRNGTVVKGKFVRE